jgi:hypothetical protein
VARDNALNCIKNSIYVIYCEIKFKLYANDGAIRVGHSLGIDGRLSLQITTKEQTFMKTFLIAIGDGVIGANMVLAVQSGNVTFVKEAFAQGQAATLENA